MIKRFVFVALTLFSVQSFAIVPPVAYALIAAGGAVYDLLQGAAIAAAGVVVFEHLTATNTDTGEAIRVPIDTSAAGIPPPPSAPATAPMSGGSYPAGFDPDTEQCSRQSSPAPTARGAGSSCSWCMANWGYVEGYWCWHIPSVAFPSEEGYTSSATTNTGTAPPTNLSGGTCPTGYTSVSGACTLSDARAVTPDSNSDYLRSGTAFSQASNADPDRLSATRPPVSTASGNNVSISGKTMYGEPTVTTTKPLANGGLEVITQIQRNNGTVEQQVLTWDASGHVIGHSTTTVSGQVSYDPATQTSTVTSSQPIVNPDGSTSSNQSTVSPPIQFPSDYARQGEAQTAANSIKEKIDNTENVVDPTQPADQQFADSFFKETFTGLLGWTMPTHTSTCPTSSFSWNSQTFTFDAHCQLVNDHFGAFQTVMAVVWVIAALFLVLRA